MTPCGGASGVEQHEAVLALDEAARADHAGGHRVAVEAHDAELLDAQAVVALLGARQLAA